MRRFDSHELSCRDHSGLLSLQRILKILTNYFGLGLQIVCELLRPAKKKTVYLTFQSRRHETLNITFYYHIFQESVEV